MTLLIFFLLAPSITVLSVTGYGLWGVFKTKLPKQLHSDIDFNDPTQLVKEKGHETEGLWVQSQLADVLHLIADANTAFLKRLLSAIAQTVLYSSLVIAALLWWVKHLGLVHWISFALGAFVMTFYAIVSLGLAPKLVKKVFLNAHGFLEPAFQSLLSLSTFLGFLFASLISLAMAGCYVFLGLHSIISFALGVAFTVLFLRVGGGLFKASSDISADVLEKREPQLPQWDMSNPATILDITSDYVGKMVGLNADLMSSFVFSIAACVLFAVGRFDLQLFILPVLIFSVGLWTSLAAVGFAKLRIYFKKTNNALLEGVYVGVVLAGFTSWGISQYFPFSQAFSIAPFAAYLSGILGGILMAYGADILTARWYNPVQKITAEVEYGPVLTFLNSMSLAFKGNGVFVLFLLGITLPAVYFAGLYGVVLSSLGILSATAVIVSVNIAATLAGTMRKIIRISGDDISEFQKNAVLKLDKIGLTTFPISYGFVAMASVVSTLSLFLAFWDLLKQQGLALYSLDFELLIGLLIGAALPYVFSGFLVKGLAVNIKASLKEVVRQFQQIPYLMEKKAKPDMAKAADNSARLAMDSMIIPACLMILVPLIVGLGWGLHMMLGLLLGMMVVALTQTVLWTLTGDVLHNARRLIENGHFGGPDSPNKDHVTTADNIGDAYKDLLSPSMGILVRVALLLAIGLVLLL